MGYLLLEGGAEFGGRMSEPDLRAIELAGGVDAPICILPTAAAPDNNHKRAGGNGMRWFQSLGAKHVFTVDVIDSKTANDAVLAGSSAGAMVMCEHYYDPYERKLLRGLNLVPNACVLPHHNNFGKAWAGQLRRMLPEALLIGVDEQTGMLSTDSVTVSQTATDVEWEVYGGGEVTLYRSESTVSYGRGGKFSLR